MTALYFHKYKYVRCIVAVLLMLFMVLLMSACTEPLYGEKPITPYDFEGSEWQSNKPTMFLQVLEDGQMKGYLLLDNEMVSIGCDIRFGEYISIFKDKYIIENDDWILEGTCKCTEQMVVIKVKEDYCFDGQYLYIVLERVDGTS